MSVYTIKKVSMTSEKIPKNAQDIIPITKIFETGMTKHKGNRYSFSYELKDIDFSSASNDNREMIFDKWSEILNSLDGSKASCKISIVNRHLNKKKVLSETLLDTDLLDGYDHLREAYNELRYEDIKGDKGFVQDKFLTMSAYKSKDEKADSYFRRFERDINNNLLKINSGIKKLQPSARMEVIYGYLRPGFESDYNYVYDPKTNTKGFKDFISADGIKFHPGHFEIGDKVGRCMMLKNIGGSIKDEFIARLSDLKTNMALSIDIVPVSNADARKIIDSKDDDVEGNAHQWSNKKTIREGSAMRIPRQVSKDRKVIDEYIKDMDENNQKMFLTQIVISFLADDLEKLDEYTETTIETAAEYSCQFSTLYFQQLEGLQDALPFGVRTINNLRDCNTDTTAIMMPFNSVKINHNSGIPYGRHTETQQQQLVDRTLLINGHEWVLGMSGSGKSSNVKLKTVFEALLTGGDIVICDPDGEYTPLIESIGGNIITVGIDNINILDVSFINTDYEDVVKDKSNITISFFESILDKKTSFGETEKSLVDRAIRSLFSRVYSGDLKSVTLVDVYNFLKTQEEAEAPKLATALERHIVGSFSCFAKPTNVETTSRIICYDLSRLDKQMKNAGMLVVLDHIDGRLRRNRARGVITYVKLDEMDYFFKHEGSTAIIENFFERARKFGGFITAIVQNVTKILEIPAAKTMLQNAANVVMMKQDSMDANILADMYSLSNIQVKSLITADIGFGINKIGDTIYPFDGTIPEENALYKLIDTKISKDG